MIPSPLFFLHHRKADQKTGLIKLNALLCIAVLLSACTTQPPVEEMKPTAQSDASTVPAPLPCPVVEQPLCPVIEQTLCPVVEQPLCPPVKQRACPPSPAAIIADKLVIGEVEMVHFDPPNLTFASRIDTGAAGTSIHASNITPFERDGRNWVRFEINQPSTGKAIVIERPLARKVLIKQATADALERRFVIKMTLTLGPLSEQVDVSLSERDSMEHPVLIGRNFLRNLAIVDVSQRLIAK